MNITGKNVLVTGGAGFAGSHLVEALLANNTRIVVADIVHDSRSYFFRKGFQDQTVLLDLDINDYEKVYDTVTKFNINYIFHLAAQPIVEVAYYNPKQTLLTNVVGTINVLEASRQSSHIEGVIVASSDKAYGKLNETQYTESTPVQGDHPYDVSKSAADLISRTYHTTYDLPVVVTRFGNIYGEGDLNSSRIIPSILDAVINRSPIVLRSDGSHTRDYLYVKDVADGYIALANNMVKTGGEAYNFGSSDTYSVIELIKEFEKALDVDISYKIMGTSKNEIPYQSLDYEKVGKTVGWKPKHSIASTAKGLLKYYSDSK